MVDPEFAFYFSFGLTCTLYGFTNVNRLLILVKDYKTIHSQCR